MRSGDSTLSSIRSLPIPSVYLDLEDLIRHQCNSKCETFLDAYIENEKELEMPKDPLPSKIAPARALDSLNPAGWMQNKNPDIPPVNDIVQ